MLIAQIFLYSFFTLPQAVQKIYSTFTVENIVFNLLLLSTYFSSEIPFYIYILCRGEIFCKTLIDISERFWTRNI